MTLPSLTSKQTKLLNQLVERSPIVAHWDHIDLSALLNLGLVRCQKGYATNGSLSRSGLWVLSQKGNAFLASKPGGR